MIVNRPGAFVLMASLVAMASPLQAAAPRQLLAEAAFVARDKAVALGQIAEAERVAAAVLAREPGNREAAFARAMALGYKAKLARHRGEALEARRLFEALAADDPRDAEAAAAVGTWHLDSVIDLGGLVAGMAIGAKKAIGFAMTDRAVALGGNRATYAGLAALLRLAIDPDDPRGRSLAERAAAAATPQPLDRVFQRSAVAILASLKGGNDKATQKLARQLLPFGRLDR
ncbi:MULTISPECIES: hypothetical protein [unclassified Sphingomonas]|uniref:hypothetical protein n=1 Tax=unclassified Sphingomonas TaxID=196159 RepID=UPI0006F5AA18|nr:MULTISPECIES: hypothetical protein [unclassified Sphingomonas]KQX20178.1 hypothetical protein ASD17_09875 [Sphingomonas sp. Root1294]KQY67428.1 hypothetical protein ASD39_09935 [Sphingomonas sp. Root50]KRB91350.1 hypothetical protein ASE22_10940 [Sphingomonas sp. Root720]